MNRVRIFAIGTILMFAVTASAQQTASSAGSAAKSAPGAAEPTVPTAEGQLKLLTTRLDLTGGQQEKIKPILRELHTATVKIVQDETLSSEESLNQVRDLRYAADKKIRTILNDDQKQKLDQLEQEPHPELHGGVGGTKN